MKWIELELGKIADVEKQAGEVIRTYETLSKQLANPRKGVNTSQVAQAVRVLKTAVVSRVLALEEFYRENDLDSRAARFETVRLKLKRTLKEAGMSPQEFAAIAQSQSLGQPQRATAASAMSGASQATTPNQTTGATGGLNRFGSAPDADGMITLKIHMTPAEFEQLRARRAAVRAVRKGEGKMAWEAAATTPRSDPAREGMYTYHEIPFQGGSQTPRGGSHRGGDSPFSGSATKVPPMRFGTADTTTPLHPAASAINQGLPYTSTNPEVFARTARFPTAADEWRGGAKAVDPARPFNAVTPRTNTSNAVSKMRPVGGSITPR